ncbi:hypothetical protein [Algoriphagus resistens]|uniref:hypothetical protein n=1 Tax=Algoriphagus resistens TaxID=1750590 RepID=UPI000716C39F|nr:hypothetical protein [Algoriphagus resistens]
MIYPNDFQITNPLIEKGGNLVDSYALISHITDKLEDCNLHFYLDNCLPIISGNSEALERVFESFIGNAVDFFKEYNGTLHIIFRQDLNSSFLTYFIRDFIPVREKGMADLIETITEFNLAMCYKLLEENESIGIQPSQN